MFCNPTKLYADNISPSQSSSELLQIPDNRILAVQSFLYSYKCGTEIQDFNDATEFVDAADKYGIDYRILPVIYLKESTCGQHEIPGTFNGFGFANGVTKFTSFANAVDTISMKLTQHPYAGKSLKGIISTYNNYPEYLASFMIYYNQISDLQEGMSHVGIDEVDK